MWGEKLKKISIGPDDMLLIIGARVTDKYGAPQLNVNSKDGKVLVNPSPQDYKLPRHFIMATVRQ